MSETKSAAAAVLERVLQVDPEALLTSRQVVLLHALQPAGSGNANTIRGLSAAFNMRKPTITRAIDKLASLGFAERAPDPEDGRSVLVYSTAYGQAVKAFLDGDEGAEAKLNAARKAWKAKQTRAAAKSVKQQATAA